jgi:hypothetical protein
MMEDFEKMLTELSKPEVRELKHQDLLADQIVRAKNRNALSFWWLLIPLYAIATLTMKTWYMKTSLKQEINLFKVHNPVLSLLLFLILPALIIVFTFFSAKGSRAGTALIILSSIVLLIYILTCYV